MAAPQRRASSGLRGLEVVIKEGKVVEVHVPALLCGSNSTWEGPTIVRKIFSTSRFYAAASCPTGVRYVVLGI
jgi:hypothetical protein